MKVRVHFGAKSLLSDAEDVETLAHHMVRLVQLELPHYFSKFVLPRDDATAPLVTAHGSAEHLPLARWLLVGDPARGEGGAKAGQAGAGGLPFELMLEAQTKAFGPLLVISRRQWEWTREVLRREALAVAASPPDASSDGAAGETGEAAPGGEDARRNGEAVPLELLLLYRCPERGILRVCRHDMFAEPPAVQQEHRGVEAISVMDARGRKMGEIRFDFAHPPPLRRLKSSLQKLLCWPYLMDVSYHVAEEEERLPLSSEADIASFVHSAQHFGHQNIRLVVALPSSPCLPPDLNGAAAAFPTREQQQQQQQQQVAPGNAPPQTAVAVPPPPPGSGDATAVRIKREETKKMVASYVQLMQGLRRGVAGLRVAPQGKPVTAPVCGNTVAATAATAVDAAEAEAVAAKATPATASATVPPALREAALPDAGEGAAGVRRHDGGFLVVHYDLDPLEVHVTGPITEAELQCLADAVTACCAGFNAVKEENPPSSPDYAGGAAAERKTFRRVSDSIYTLQLHEYGSPSDVQVAELEACLVDVVKGFGCLQVTEATEEVLKCV
ncbi:uncharacterized protein Tco025E_03539 [Trypanosoma conorhini]|uniref:Uncharacterized protein n=1 Tax=Trypanosoma conorhini TaxID=83891 RepID=A0A3R7MUX3_9TRYP|nr:uncharacterized protein Tco025E_03539 [Trypanosoma conorhini]RNF21086.1 hypothetical protein Tco025E_03539 [Trypanosoma conorhini]